MLNLPFVETKTRLSYVVFGGESGLEQLKCKLLGLGWGMFLDFVVAD